MIKWKFNRIALTKAIDDLDDRRKYINKWKMSEYTWMMLKIDETVLSPYFRHHETWT